MKQFVTCVCVWWMLETNCLKFVLLAFQIITDEDLHVIVLAILYLKKKDKNV